MVTIDEQRVGTLGEIGAYDQYEQEVRKAHDRARQSKVDRLENPSPAWPGVKLRKPR